MFYQEKKVIATMISVVLILAAYSIYIFQKYQEGSIDLEYDLKFWASTMLIFIGVGIVSTVLILIIFNILNAIVNEVKQEEQDVSIDDEDEMDRLIALKATRNSYLVVGIGFLLSLVTLVLQKPPAVMLNIIYLVFHLGLLVEGFSQLYFYRRGVRNV